MGCTMVTGDKDTERSIAIDERLAYENSKRKNEVKLLLLGNHLYRYIYIAR